MAKNVQEPKAQEVQDVQTIPKSRYLVIVVAALFGWFGAEFVGAQWGFFGIAIFLAALFGLPLLAMMFFSVRGLQSTSPTQPNHEKQ